MNKRNWLVEDNIVALYVALHKYEDLNYDLEEIEKILALRAVPMRINNFKYIDGQSGLSAGGPAPSWKQLYSIFKDFDQKKFAELANEDAGWYQTRFLPSFRHGYRQYMYSKNAQPSTASQGES